MTIVQWITMFVIGITIILEVIWIFKSTFRKWLAYPILVWLTLSMAYYLAIATNLPIDSHTLSQSLRLLGYITALTMVIYRLRSVWNE